MRNRGISPNNWLEVLQGLLVKRRFLEAEWTAARNFYGISELLGDDDDEVYEVPTLEGRSSDESNGTPGTRLSYHTIPLENKVCFASHKSSMSPVKLIKSLLKGSHTPRSL